MRERFKYAHQAVGDSNYLLDHFKPIGPVDKKYRNAQRRLNEFSRKENAINDYYACEGVKKQYKNVNFDNAEQQKSFAEHIHFYKTGKLNQQSKDYKTHLSIVQQYHEDRRWASNVGTAIGKLADVANLYAGGLLHPGAKTFNFVWTIFGNEAKDFLKRYPQEKYHDLAVNFIELHGHTPAALSEFMDKFSVADEPIQKAIFGQLFDNAKLNQNENQKLTNNIIDILKSNFAKLGKKQITKENIEEAVANELKKHSLITSDDIKDIKDYVSDLSSQLDEHLQAVSVVKNSHSKFDYHENEIKGFGTCAQFLSEVATFTNSKELLGAAKFMQGVAGIAGALNNLDRLKMLSNMSPNALGSGMLSAVGPLALTGGYAAVGIAAFSLVSSFMDQGPSADQLILEFLQDLAQYISEEFNKIHKELEGIHKDMIKGFTSVLEACQKIFDLLNETLDAVHNAQKILGIKLDEIKDEIDALHNLAKTGFEVLAAEKFNTNIRKLNDLLSGQNKKHEETQELLNELVGDYLLNQGKEYISYYTGTFHFDPNKIHELTPDSNLLFFSDKREIDDFFAKDKSQADWINGVLSKNKLSSLLGFFAEYSERILLDQHKSSQTIQNELNIIVDNIKSAENDIKNKQKIIDELSDKKSPNDIEKSQLEQEQKNLKAHGINLEKHKKKQEKYIKLKVEVEAAEKRNKGYQDGVNKNIIVLSNRQKEIANNIVERKKSLRKIISEVEKLCPGLKFLYDARNTLQNIGLTEIAALYQNIYEKRLNEICVEFSSISIDKKLLKKKLGLDINQKNDINFEVVENNYNDRRLRKNAYLNALNIFSELFSQEKENDAFELESKLIKEEKVRLEASLTLAEAYERKPLTDGLVFNPMLWILAVAKYLEVIQDSKLSPYYNDEGLQHAQKLIVKGKNFLHFIQTLQNSSQLFEELWRAYATALISVHKYYRREWQDYFKKLELQNEGHLENQIIINPKIVLDQEVEFTRDILNTDILLGKDFEKRLAVLDAQKNILTSFNRLTGSDKQVALIIDKLWGKNEIKNQLNHLLQKERGSAKITMLEVYEYLNQCFLSITQYSAKSDLIEPEMISAISSLVAHLQQHVNAKTIKTQTNFYDAKLLSSNNFFPQEDLLFNEVWDQNLFERDEFECLVNSALEKAVMDNTNNAVLFIGETRSGKSSFICYLMDCKMEFRDIGEGEDILIATNCPTEKIPKIGHKSASQTLFPAGYKKDSYVYIDFPGIEDTRSTDEALLAALATQVAIKTIRSIKRIVIVIDFNDISNKNARNLAKIVSLMSKIFRDFNKNKNDITLVVSKLKLKDEAISKQKQRIINQLIAFDKAIQAGNYENDVKDRSIVHELLSVFINSKNRSNLILFDPLKSNAKDELIAQIASKQKGFLPDVLNFVGDQKQKKQFFEKVQNSLEDAIDVLNTLIQYPNIKSKLEAGLNQANIEEDLMKLEKSHQNAFKIYCVHRTFWQKLITLHGIIKFDFEQYDKFNKLFSSYSVHKQKCEELTESLACKEFEEPEATNINTLHTCSNNNDKKCSIFSNGAVLENSRSINCINDIDKYDVIYDTNKRMSAARESLTYRFFSLIAKSINFFKQESNMLVQQAISSFSIVTNSANYVSSYYANTQKTEFCNQPENQIQIINTNSFMLSEISVIPTCGQSNLSASRLINSRIINESDCFMESFDQCQSFFYEKEQTDADYISNSPPKFVGGVDSNLMLARVWVHMLQESYNWITGIFSSENTVENEEQIGTTSEYASEMFRDLKEELQSTKRLLTSLIINRRNPQDFGWARDALEYHREKLLVLQKSAKIRISDLEEIKLDILHLKDEIKNELVPIETILKGSASKQMSKFGIFCVNNTALENIYTKALVNQNAEAPSLPSNAKINFLGK